VTALIGILKKELKVAFTTPVAYVVFFAFALWSSIVFYRQLLAYEDALQRSRHLEDTELLALLNFNDFILSVLFANIQVVFVFLVPVLTMRSFAEERKQRTMELLMTTPIGPWQVIVGKFLAYIVVVGCLCLIVAVYPTILTVFGDNTLIGATVIDWPTTVLGLLGVLLAGAMFGAIGFAFSSVTESQIVAALLTLFSLLVLWQGVAFAQEAPGWLGDTLMYVTPFSHMTNFARGVLHLGDVTYYLSVAVFFLFVTHRVLEGQRWR
jgi:ABC-2 type transport system permease protein